MDEKLISRTKLLYERDNNSPLFLRTADLYLSENEIEKAHQIIEHGLKVFPDHPVALILLGKLNYSKGNIEEADSAFFRASEVLNSNQTYTYYKKEFKLPDKSSSPFSFSRGNVFVNPLEDSGFQEKQLESPNDSDSIDDSLSDLAEKVMNARIERNENFLFPENKNESYTTDKNRLASETLANIYLSQGEKNEAIKIFEILIDRNPEKKDYYLEKILKIKSQ